MTQSETTEVAMQAQVEQVRPGEWRVRCGNPKCVARDNRPPLSKPRILCQLACTGPVRLRLLCPRCHAYSSVEIG